MSTLMLNPKYKGGSTPTEPQYVERSPGRCIDTSPKEIIPHDYKVLPSDNFTDDEVLSINDLFIANLTIEDIQSLTPMQVALLYPNQVANLTAEQIGAMSVLQLRTFRPFQSNMNEMLRARIVSVFTVKLKPTETTAILKAQKAAEGVIQAKGLPSQLSQVTANATATAKAKVAAQSEAKKTQLAAIIAEQKAGNVALAEQVAIKKAQAKSTILKNLAVVKVSQALPRTTTAAEAREVAASVGYDVKNLSGAEIRDIATPILSEKARQDAEIKDAKKVKSAEVAQEKEQKELNAPDIDKVKELGILDKVVNYVYKTIYK